MVVLMSGQPDDRWLREAVAAVDRVIDAFVVDYVQHPFRHRVEHSLHADLFERLKREESFSGYYPIGGSSHLTQLVHKEWPEDAAQNAIRRGSYDLAILSPTALGDRSVTLEHFDRGRISPPIVIEMGLNYDHDHLKEDYAKLRDNQVRFGYLVHLERDLPVRKQVRPRPKVVDFLRDPARHQDVLAPSSIKIAYAHWSMSGAALMKPLGQPMLDIVARGVIGETDD